MKLPGRLEFALIKLGHEVRLISPRFVKRDINPAREADARSAGAIVCTSAQELATHCDIVITLVVDDQQTDEVLFGSQGAAAALRPGSVVIMSKHGRARLGDGTGRAAGATRCQHARCAGFRRSGASRMFADRIARVLKEDNAVNAALHMLKKDRSFAAAAAQLNNVPTPVANAALAMFSAASEARLSVTQLLPG